MKVYVARLHMLDEKKSADYREEHLSYLEALNQAGQIVGYGRFVDGTGGMIIYRGETEEEVKRYALEDPYIVKGARTLELKEWAMVQGKG
ncbi:YciI family protein [Marininema halotolerans]|uniref:YCII-related domain-containing protein n=1 Tax=Marininema halotolerans TaxID=1155944 RepID=A0A1I6TNZ8_9BACL|nr:YciI family protein [Marininema halotolerans]SFS90858.1 hypothetical protein SAMN05444972_110175 [Marininema halotolerans]